MTVPIDGVGDLTTVRVSELRTAGNCLRQLGYRRYVQLGGDPETARAELRRAGVSVSKVDAVGIVSAPSAAMIGGSAVDATLNEHHQQRIDGKNGLRGSALTDFAVTAHRKLLSETGELSGDPDPDIEKDMVGVLPVYEKEIDPIIHPVSVQRTESKSYENGKVMTLVGHLDLVRASPTNSIVTDHKFTTKSASQMPAETSIQLHGYSELTGIDQTELILLRRLKTPRVETTSTFVTKTQRGNVVRTLRNVVRALESRFFPLTDPTSWCCTPRYCGFYPICRGREDGPLPIPGEETV